MFRGSETNNFILGWIQTIYLFYTLVVKDLLPYFASINIEHGIVLLIVIVLYTDSTPEGRPNVATEMFDTSGMTCDATGGINY